MAAEVYCGRPVRPSSPPALRRRRIETLSSCCVSPQPSALIPQPYSALLRPISARHLDVALFTSACHAHAPRITADLAVLHEAAAHVGLDVNFHLLAAVGARHEKLVIHKPGIAVDVY